MMMGQTPDNDAEMLRDDDNDVDNVFVSITAGISVSLLVVSGGI